jgi:hypothetical protein
VDNAIAVRDTVARVADLEPRLKKLEHEFSREQERWKRVRIATTRMPVRHAVRFVPPEHPLFPTPPLKARKKNRDSYCQRHRGGRGSPRGGVDATTGERFYSS